MTKATSKNEPIEELDIATVDPMAKKAGKEFPGWLYGVLFVLFDAVGVAALQIGVSESATRVQLSNNMWLTGWGFVGKMFTSANFVAVLNLILWGVLYVILLMLTNRFWVATPIFLAVTFIVAVIEHFKVSIRYEAILPSDLNFLKADAGNLMSFMPSGAQWTILIAVAAFAAFVALFVFLNRLDARHGRLFRGSDKQSRWLVGQRLRHRHGGQALHVGLRIRRPAQRAAGGVHPSAQPESHGQAGRLFRRDHEAGRGPL